MDTLSAESEKVLAIARHEAAGLHQEFTGTEHLLLGLLAGDDDIAAPLLSRHGIVAVEVRAQVARPGSGRNGSENAQPLTARAKQVLSLASDEAEALDDDEVRPEHLLLGIIRQASGVAALLLHDMGVDLAELREEILEARTAIERIVTELAVVGSPFDQDGDGNSQAAKLTIVGAAQGGSHDERTGPSPAVVPPSCPGCGKRLSDVLAIATVSPEAPGALSRRRGFGAVTLIYCGACGHTLAASR